MTAGSLVYVYAVAREPAATLVTMAGTLTGVAGSPVHLVLRSPALAAVVSPVPERDFHETALRRHLEDLGWLEALARAHHGVIEAFSTHATVLPLRLATVYRDDDRVRAVLHDRQGLFLDRLGRLDGHVELGVKIYVDRGSDTPSEPAPPAASSSDPPLGPGRSYLRHRRAEQDSRNDAERAAERAAERIEATARAHAVERARHRIQEGELATAPGVNVSNDAYLVPAAHADAFRAEALRSTDGLTGVRVDVTGPWAPYSFAGLPEPDPPGSAP
ncbi:GvpL/GvpF family gas vesicle protein [Kitasatospora sp. NBC_00315]|uniref:GvpL/GvpF family gas vesicle protein n=1 Tax=Kitasatospora sp. NBC_00315 TaxID=2975963 RepID=UPI0032469213